MKPFDWCLAGICGLYTLKFFCLAYKAGSINARAGAEIATVNIGSGFIAMWIGSGALLLWRLFG